MMRGVAHLAGFYRLFNVGIGTEVPFRVDGAVEILEGLKAGAQVVTAGNTRLSDGAAIIIVTSASN